MARGPDLGKGSRSPDREGSSTATVPTGLDASPGRGRRAWAGLVSLGHAVSLGWYNCLTRHPFWTVCSVGVLVLVPGYVAGPIFYVGLGLALSGWREARALDRAERRLIRDRLGLADPRPDTGRGRHSVNRPDDADPDADRYADAFNRADDRANVRSAVNAARTLVGGSVPSRRDPGSRSPDADEFRSPDRLVV